MAQDRGKQPLRIGTRKRELVGVADAGGLHLHHDLAFFRAFQVDFDDLERFLRLEGDGGAGFHVFPSSALAFGFDLGGGARAGQPCSVTDNRFRLARLADRRAPQQRELA